MRSNYFLPLIVTALSVSSPFLILGEEEVPAIQHSTQVKTELELLESELENLNKKLKTARKKSLNDEMDAQRLMFDNWHQYAEDIKENEADEKMITKIKSRIKELTERKQELLKVSPN